ncbi:MAG: alkaline phosphatase family protein [Candidatus Dormibacteria bacterium]
MEVRPSRRELLKAGVGAGAAAASLLASPGLPQWLTEALAAAPSCGKLTDIEHVVILLQENRSFDHYFGAYKGVRGFSDPGAIRQLDGTTVFAQKTGAGDQRRLPFHLDTGTSNAECTNDISHSWGTQHQSWNGGRMDQWMIAHGAADGANAPLTMGYYARADLPFYYALADAFTVCDGYFSSAISSTDSNRLMSISGTLDPDGFAGGPILSTVGPTSRRSRNLRWTTYPEQLEARGISWKVYQSAETAVDTNPLALFAQYQDPTSSIYRKAFGSVGWAPASEVPTDFYADCLAGTLPQVSWVIAPDLYQEHPPFPPAWGEAAVSQLVRALTANPAVWSRSVMFITYDENGGFFDHVPPPTPPAPPDPLAVGEWLPASNSTRPSGPVGLGFRVPTLVVSPFSRNTATDGSALVCSDTFDHTSLLRFVETRFGAEIPMRTGSRPGLSAWRRGAVGDLTGALNFAAPDLSVPSLPLAITADPVVQECVVNGTVFTEVGLPSPFPPYAAPATEVLPRQEPGRARRPSGPCGPSAAPALAGAPQVPAAAPTLPPTLSGGGPAGMAIGAVAAGAVAAAVAIRRSLRGGTAH